MVKEGKVAKKLALYPPKRLMNELGLKEGQRVRYNVENGKLVVEPVPDPIDMALQSKKWAKTSARELELESEKEQSKLYA
jgi:antitoxin component of MazEF toxin-antitoxin module